MYSMSQVNARYMYVYTSVWRKSQKPPRQYLITHLIHYIFAICNCYACSYYSKRTDGYLAHIVITTIYIVHGHTEVQYKIKGEHSLSLFIETLYYSLKHSP